MSNVNAPERRARPRGHWQLVYKITISVVGFLAAYTLASSLPQDSGSETLWNTGASLFVAGIIFVAQYLIEVDHRMSALERVLNRHVERTDDQLRDGFSKIHLASELFSLGERAQLQPEEMAQMTKLVLHSTKIATQATPLVQEFARNEIRRLSDYLRELGANANLAYRGEDRDWLLGLTRVATKSIQATSLSTVDAGGRSFIDGGLWRSDLGLRYIEAQKQAIRRGVKIQRIFIIDREDLDPAGDLSQILIQHLEIGVEVRTLNATAAPGIMPPLQDFIIFDDELCYQSTPAAQPIGRQPLIVNTTLTWSPDEVGERCREFGDLWNSRHAVSVTMDPEGNLTPPDPEAG